MSSESTDSQQARWFPRHTWFFAGLIALLVVLFAVMRLGLLVRNSSSASQSSTWGIASSFVYGVRFDLATACYIVLPFVVLGHLPSLGLRHSNRHRRIVYWILVVLAPVLIFVLLAEYEFFREFQTRYNQLAFQYLDQPKIVAGMIWYNYPVFWYLLVCALLAAGFAMALRWLMRRTLRVSDTERQQNPLAEALCMAALIGLMVVGMRGGLQGEPLRWGHAVVGHDDFVNQLNLNGLFSLAKAGQNQLRHGKTSEWLRHMPIDEARLIARQMIVEPTERLLDPEGRTVLRDGRTAPNTIALTGDSRPPNVVLVMMESFSARFVGACGSIPTRTPRFDELAAEGVIFNHAFSGGTHTHQGVFCTMLGFPNLPGYEYLMDSPVANQPFLSLPAILSKQGYQSIFLYNGNLAWDNMYGFYKQQGMQKFIGTKEYVNPVMRDRVWGVTDQDVFDRANQEFEQLNEKGPFLGVILTLSNHAPFDLPEPVQFERTTDMGELNKRIDAIRYADWAVGRFIDQARKLEYFKNTLFVFVGDHGFHVDPKLTETHLLYHHVPLLIYSPLLSKKGMTLSQIAGQVDIIPTILGLLSLDAPRASWGRNLLSSAAPEPFTVFKGSGGTGSDQAVALLVGDRMLVVGSTGTTELWRYQLGVEPSATRLEGAEHEPEMLRLRRQLDAYVQSAMHELSMQKAGPPRGELLYPTTAP